jgi:hypothetical protein
MRRAWRLFQAAIKASASGKYLRIGRPPDGNLSVGFGLSLSFDLSAVEAHAPDRRRSGSRVDASLTLGPAEPAKNSKGPVAPPCNPCHSLAILAFKRDLPR